MAEDKKNIKQVPVSKYTVQELAEAPKLFESTPDLVLTALQLDGKESYSMEEAMKVVRAFSNKRVK